MKQKPKFSNYLIARCNKPEANLINGEIIKIRAILRASS